MDNRRGGSMRFGAPHKSPGGGRIIGIVLIVLLAAAAVFVWYKNSDSLKTFFEGLGDSKPAYNNNNNSGKGKSNGKTDANGNKSEDKPAKRVKDVSILKTQIEGYVGNLNGTYGIYFINLAENTEFGINDTEEYVAASTIKVPLNLYLYKQVEDGKADLQSEMTYTSADKEGGTGSIQYEKTGTSFTLRELSQLSIEQSDNVATNMLIRELGRQQFKDYMKEMGGTVVHYDSNLTSPKDMGIYLRKVYDESQAKPELYGDMIRYMQNTIFNDRISKLLPSDINVAHKIGNYWDSKYGVVVNDVGIVYTEQPFVITVLSKNVNEQEAYDTIAQISKMAYEFMTTKQPMVEAEQPKAPEELQK